MSQRPPSGATRKPDREHHASPYLNTYSRIHSSSRPASGVPSRVSSATTRRDLPSATTAGNAAAATESQQHSDKLVLEQISRLKAQCEQLERESKEAEVTMQETIQQNRLTWMVLKQENKQFKQQLMQRRDSVTQTTAAEEQNARAISALEKKVHDLRRLYDRIMQEKKTAVAKLANCQDGVQELHKAVGGQGPGSLKASTLNGSASSTLPWDSKEGRAIRQLENRLTKAQLKANEAQSLRRVYEQVLQKVRKEQLGHGPYVQSLEAALQAKDSDHSRLTQALLEAQHVKEKAKQELADFSAKQAQQRAAREAVLREQRAKAGTLGAANKALLAQQFGSKEAALQVEQQQQQQQQQQDGQEHDSRGEAIERPHAQGHQHQQHDQHTSSSHAHASANNSQAGTTAGVPARTQEQEQQQQHAGLSKPGSQSGLPGSIASAADAVQRLCEACCAPSAQAMLDRMLPRHETHANLLGMQAAAQAEEAQLNREVAAARRALEDAQHGSRSSSMQACLDAAQAELVAANQRAEAAKEAHAKIMHAYVDVRSGLEHIATMLVQLPLPQGHLPIPLSEDTLGDVLAQSHLRLANALKFIQGLPKANALLEKLLQQADQVA